MEKSCNKNAALAALITAISITACVIHAVILNSPFNHYLYTSALKVILFILSPAVYFAVSKSGGAASNIKGMFTGGDKKSIKRCLIFALSVFTFILLLAALLNPWLDRELIIGGLAHNGITAKTFPLVFAYVVFINAALEEIFFRGFVFYTLYKMGLKRYAGLYSCLLFAFYHAAILGESVSAGIFIFFMFGLAIAGVIFNNLTKYCKCLQGSLLVHMAANMAINTVVVYFFLGYAL